MSDKDNAAPVGEREAFEAWFESINHYKPDVESGHVSWWYSDPRVDAAWDVWQARAAYQRAQQPQSAEAVEIIDLDAAAWQSIKDAAHKSSWIPEQYFLNDWVADVCAFLADNPQPSAGVVMPERKSKPYGKLYMPDEYEGWNACLDEFARLNGKETV